MSSLLTGGTAWGGPDRRLYVCLSVPSVTMRTSPSPVDWSGWNFRGGQAPPPWRLALKSAWLVKVQWKKGRKFKNCLFQSVKKWLLWPIFDFAMQEVGKTYIEWMVPNTKWVLPLGPRRKGGISQIRSRSVAPSERVLFVTTLPSPSTFHSRTKMMMEGSEETSASGVSVSNGWMNQSFEKYHF